MRDIQPIAHRIGALVLIAGIGACAYKPGSFRAMTVPFAGVQRTVGCLDIAVEAVSDPAAEGPVAGIKIGNRCDAAVVVDLGAIAATAHYADGRVVPTRVYDPKGELHAATLEARAVAHEVLEYQLPARRGMNSGAPGAIANVPSPDATVDATVDATADAAVGNDEESLAESRGEPGAEDGALTVPAFDNEAAVARAIAAVSDGEEVVATDRSGAADEADAAIAAQLGADSADGTGDTDSAGEASDADIAWPTSLCLDLSRVDIEEPSPTREEVCVELEPPSVATATAPAATLTAPIAAKPGLTTAAKTGLTTAPKTARTAIAVADIAHRETGTAHGENR